MHKWILLAVSLVVLGPASAAHAGAITVDFDFTDTTVDALGVSIPPNGSITAAFAKITVPGAGLITPSAGSGTFESLSISATVDALGAVTGFLIANQIGTAAASLTAGLTNVQVFAPSNLSVSLSLDCSGFLCGLIPATFPITLFGPQTINDTFTLMVNNLSVNGGATIMGILTFDFNGTTAMVNLSGTEITRTFDLPEPGAMLQLGAGVAALVGLGLLRRRRR